MVKVQGRKENMTDTKLHSKIHPVDTELANYLDGLLQPERRHEIEEHMASCDECLARIVAAHESVVSFNKETKIMKGRGNFMKKINLYLILAIVSFTLSFTMPRFFLQLLVATLLLGTKWIVDSKTTRMLVTIYDAWKTSEKEKAQASRLGHFLKKLP